MSGRWIIRGRLPSGAGLVLACLQACKTDTSGLELRAPSAAGQSGAGGVAGSSGGSGAVGLGGAGGSAEPLPASGPSELHLVHGVVDGGRLLSCYLDAPSGELRTALPEPAGGLTFAGVLSRGIDWDVTSEAVQVELFTLTEESAADVTCAELLASAPPDAGTGTVEIDAGAPDAGTQEPVSFVAPTTPRRAGSLLLAAGALRSGSSYALVSAGCATVVAALPRAACGARDEIARSHLSLGLVEISGPTLGHQKEERFGLQFLNGSRSAGVIDAALEPTTEGLPAMVVASAVPFGSLRPRAPVAVAAPGAVLVGVSGMGSFQYRQDWQQTLERSRIEGIEAARGYALTYVGPALDTAARPNGIEGPALVLVPGLARGTAQ